MKKITIEVVFNQSGHGDLNVIPTHFSPWVIYKSSSRDFNLDIGDYRITYIIVTEGGGSILVKEGDTVLQKVTLKNGLVGGGFDITVV
jgi:hypothetical protein